MTMLVLIILTTSPNHIVHTDAVIMSSDFEHSQINHSVINITSDDDFVNQGWTGSGTEEDPFVIQGLRIQATDWCIRVENTRSHFRIVDCEFSPVDGTHRGGVGVMLRNVSNAVIESCKMTGLGLAIYDLNGSDNIHRENIIDYCWDAILIDSCQNVTAVNNTQTLTEQNSGVTLYNSKQCVVSANDLESIHLMVSTECTFLDNNLHGKGFQFFCMTASDWRHHFDNNWINGKRFGYFLESSGLSIDGSLYAQLVLVSCDDITVNQGTLQEVFTGIQIIDSSKIVLQDMTVRDNHKRGIVIQDSTSCSVVNDVFEANQYDAILISQSDKIIVENNQVNYSTTGIEIQGSTNCEINRNIVHDQWDGILVSESVSCRVYGNNVYNNYRGVRLERSNQCEIVENVISKNEMGVFINQGAYNNSIYWNSFFSNSENARDNGQFNIWDDSLRRGNGWDDYSGFGVYEIPGVAGSVDRFPCRSVYLLPLWTIYIVLLSSLIVLIIVVSKRKIGRPRRWRTG